MKGQAEQERSAGDVLAEFDRWPTWMWANEEVATSQLAAHAHLQR
jgi:erythromycin esterase